MIGVSSSKVKMSMKKRTCGQGQDIICSVRPLLRCLGDKATLALAVPLSSSALSRWEE